MNSNGLDSLGMDYVFLIGFYVRVCFGVDQWNQGLTS
jgi:hypothetical protein